MGALNTLAACEDSGGAKVLAERLAADPSGELATLLENYEFAKTIVREANRDTTGPPRAD